MSLEIDIAGFGALRLAHLVLDFNGTLALDGRLLVGVKARLAKLDRSLRIHVLTADTAALGIAAIQREGAAVETLQAADIVVHDVRDALDLLLAPRRREATLRS